MITQSVAGPTAPHAIGVRCVCAMQVHGDPWAKDPGCDLTDEECGLVPGSRIREPAW